MSDSIIISKTALSRDTRTVLDRVRRDRVTVIVTDYGRPDYVLLDYEEYGKLRAAAEQVPETAKF